MDKNYFEQRLAVRYGGEIGTEVVTTDKITSRYNVQHNCFGIQVNGTTIVDPYIVTDMYANDLLIRIDNIYSDLGGKYPTRVYLTTKPGMERKFGDEIPSHLYLSNGIYYITDYMSMENVVNLAGIPQEEVSYTHPLEWARAYEKERGHRPRGVFWENPKKVWVFVEYDQLWSNFIARAMDALKNGRYEMKSLITNVEQEVQRERNGWLERTQAQP